MKKLVIAMRLHRGHITIDGIPTKLNLPRGCLGLSFLFESKKAARAYWGKDTELLEVKIIESEKKK